jgi:Chaperone of endosialidase
MKTKSFVLILAVLTCFTWLTGPAVRAGISRGGNRNTNQGVDALHNNTTGSDNSAFGYQALFTNTTASQNTAVGSQALYNFAGSDDVSPETAVGFQALYSDVSGTFNQAFGSFALFSSVDGIRNCAVGNGALQFMTTGDSNTAVGNATMVLSGTVNFNSALGRRALFRTQGDQNIGLGFFAGSNLNGGNNNIFIANVGPVPIGSESNTIRIGTQIPATATTATESHPMPAHTDTYIAGIFGSSTGTPGMPVYVDANGKLGTVPSSTRFKKDVEPMKHASEAIFSLRPVTFHYKPEVTKDATIQFGLVAEEVVKTNPDLVVRNAKGEIHSVRYEAVNAMMLNELIKEHRQVQELTAQLKEQAAMLQKVSAQVELMKAAPKTVAEK